MALTPSILVLKPKYTNQSPPLFHHLRRSKTTQLRMTMGYSKTTTRRTISIVVATTSILEAILNHQTSNALDFSMTVPGQTVEEAENGIKSHTQSLLEVKKLLESELWKEAQKALRKSASYLKQDMYTIIQGKPGNERPQLRILYSTLFNNVTRLDYAARDKNVTRVSECYHNIVVALNDFLSRI